MQKATTIEFLPKATRNSAGQIEANITQKEKKEKEKGTDLFISPVPLLVDCHAVEVESGSPRHRSRPSRASRAPIGILSFAEIENDYDTWAVMGQIYSTGQ